MNTLGSCLKEENRPAVFTPKTSGFPVIISIYTNVFKTLSLNFKNDVFSVSRINTIVKKKKSNLHVSTNFVVRFFLHVFLILSNIIYAHICQEKRYN